MGRKRGSIGNKKYISVSIPADLIKRIDLIIKSGVYGYESRPELIKDAVRRRLKELEKERFP